MLTSAEIEARASLWQALSELFLDTELQEHDFRHIASIVLQSGFSPGEIQRILWAEVFPALADNLRAVAGEWAGFPAPGLRERIVQVLSEPRRRTVAAGPSAEGATRKIVADAWSEVCKFLPAVYRARMKVYYNSGCPVCKAGIEGQMEKGSSCEIQWADVHKNNALVSEVHADLESVRERLHVVDEEEKLHVGFDAFLAIWRNSPTERWKARVMGLPVIRQLCQVGYNLFAAALYRWNRSRNHW